MTAPASPAPVLYPPKPCRLWRFQGPLLAGGPLLSAAGALPQLLLSARSGPARTPGILCANPPAPEAASLRRTCPSPHTRAAWDHDDIVDTALPGGGTATAPHHTVAENSTPRPHALLLRER